MYLPRLVDEVSSWSQGPPGQVDVAALDIDVVVGELFRAEQLGQPIPLTYLNKYIFNYLYFIIIFMCNIFYAMPRYTDILVMSTIPTYLH
jgi:hypothetical protein